MWSYQKTLQYPVNIKNPNPALAKLIITQLGGPDGELGASLRYLSQRYAMPYKECIGILTDIGTEELGHMEMISAIVYQLTRNLTPEQKYYLMGKQYEAEKAAHGGDRKSTDAKSSSLKANLIDNSKTCDRIAEENGVSKDTVIRASKYMKGVEIAEELMPGLKQSILSGQTKVSKADMHRLARAAYNDRAQTLQDILHPELKAEPTPDADGVIRVPGKAPVMPFRKFESVYDSDAYPEDVRYEYVALEELTTRFRISFNYQLEQMPDNAQRDVILEIIHKHKDYLTSLEAALADVKDQTA